MMKRLDAATRPASEHHDHTAINRSRPESGKYAVDVLQLRFADLDADLALSGEGDGFRQILAAADDRAPKRDPLEHDIEDGRGELARRQSDKTDRALAPHHLEGLA